MHPMPFPILTSALKSTTISRSTLHSQVNPLTTHRAPLAAELVFKLILHTIQSQHHQVTIDRVDMGSMRLRSSSSNYNWWTTMLVVVSMALVMPMLATAADSDPLQDFCVANLNSSLAINGFECKPANKVTVDDFKSAALQNAGNTNNSDKAKVTGAFVAEFPGLNTLGISAARVDFAKGGVNTPHSHPRAAEILMVVEGELYVGFVSTNNTLFATVLKTGELFVFPKGLVHFQLNIGSGTAMAFAALSSQNPGRTTVAPALFTPDIKDEVLERAFKIDEKTVDSIQKSFRA